MLHADSFSSDEETDEEKQGIEPTHDVGDESLGEVVRCCGQFFTCLFSCLLPPASVFLRNSKRV